MSIFGGKGAWTGREELMLLDAVEFYGFGNWERVAQDVETRTAEGNVNNVDHYSISYDL